ncbi:MAG TPA: hypothetical protein PKI34_12240 [Bacteroidales bacterium]|nr:hypothetical protein [Bacteroidales bacterium]
MKTQVKILAVLLLVSAFTVLIPEKTVAHHRVVIGFQVFYDELAPYGTWVYHPVHGYVWVPDAGPGFYPYASEGHWVLTWAGWTWVSNYPWGWAPFHYGRWYMDPFYGPMWIPGYEWGPGWVAWRKSGDYYGWAPIGPGVNIYVAYGNAYHIPHHHWRFLKGHHFGKHDQYHYYSNVSENTAFIDYSTVINNIRNDQPTNVPYNAGPDRREVERSRGEPVSTVTIREREKPGQYLDGNMLQLYAPEVEKDGSNGRKAAPSRVAKLEDLKGKTRTSENISRNTKDQTASPPPERQHKVTDVKNTERGTPPPQNVPSRSNESVKRSGPTTPSGSNESVKRSGPTASSENSGNVKPSSQSTRGR